MQVGGGRVGVGAGGGGSYLSGSLCSVKWEEWPSAGGEDRRRPWRSEQRVLTVQERRGRN